MCRHYLLLCEVLNYSDMPSKINWCEPETFSTRRVVDNGLCVPRNDMMLQLSKISSHLWDKAYWVSVGNPIVQELLIISCHRYCSQQNPSLRTCDKTTSSASTEILTVALVKIQIFWVITSCLLENSCRGFGGTYCYYRNSVLAAWSWIWRNYSPPKRV